MKPSAFFLILFLLLAITILWGGNQWFLSPYFYRTIGSEQKILLSLRDQIEEEDAYLHGLLQAQNYVIGLSSEELSRMNALLPEYSDLTVLYQQLPRLESSATMTLNLTSPNFKEEQLSDTLSFQSIQGMLIVEKISQIDFERLLQALEGYPRLIQIDAYRFSPQQERGTIRFTTFSLWPMSVKGTDLYPAIRWDAKKLSEAVKQNISRDPRVQERSSYATFHIPEIFPVKE